MAGYATTCGTKFLGKTPAVADALAVARLRAAGAILFGKTHLPELGTVPSGINPWHGIARNPYDPCARHRRLVFGLGRVRRHGPDADRARLRRRRLDPHPRRAQRRRRAQGLVRARADGRRRGALLVARAQGSAGGFGGRHAGGVRRGHRRAAGAARAAAPLAHRRVRALVAVGRRRGRRHRARRRREHRRRAARRHRPAAHRAVAARRRRDLQRRGRHGDGRGP